MEGIAASTPQRKVAPTCFNKEYIIAAWWRFQQKKNCFSRRPSAVPLRRKDPTPRGCSGEFKIKLTVRRCLMIKTNLCVCVRVRQKRNTRNRRATTDAQRTQCACTHYSRNNNKIKAHCQLLKTICWWIFIILLKAIEKCSKARRIWLQNGMWKTKLKQ